MDLTHHVRVPAPPDEVFDVLSDPVRLAAVLPGSQVDEAADETFSGTFKIKLGSALVALAGTGRYVSRDREAGALVVSTAGADRRGDARVEATHEISLAPAEDGAETDVAVASTLTWGGRPARLGAGVVTDAVDRVLAQAGSRTTARVAEGLPWAPAADSEVAGEAAEAGSDAAGSGAADLIDHPVELGTELGDVDESSAGPSSAPAPSPSPGPAPRPEPREYVYRPYSNTAEPHVAAAKTLTKAARKHLLPYAGLGVLAVFAAATAVRRARR